ncbi:MAG: hypothetical protein K2X63_08400, partial [Burkholderiaceae bacterium]|nr:hypothetical protein [Burkholderiaceae bacterium]
DIDSLQSAMPASNAPITLHIHFNGGSQQIAGGNINVSAVAPAPDLTLQPALKINDHQKRILRALRDEIIKTAEKCGLQKHPGTIMKRMNIALGVEKYHDIEQERFIEAHRHLEAKLSALQDYEKFIAQMATYHNALKSGLFSAGGALDKNPELSTALASLSSAQFPLKPSVASDLEKLYLTVIADI